MPACQPVECVYEDYLGGEQTRISSYGRRRRRRETSFRENPLTRWLDRPTRSTVDTGSEVLVTHVFSIKDKFDRKSRADDQPATTGQTASEDNAAADISDDDAAVKKESVPPRRRFFNEDSLSFSPEAETTETFTAEGLEVCLNLSGLIVGVGVFLVVQLVLVFAWTHFWQTRQKKKRNLPYTTR